MKARINSTIAVPLEMKELFRQIQRAEQLTVAINLQVTQSISEKLDRELVDDIRKIFKIALLEETCYVQSMVSALMRNKSR